MSDILKFKSLSRLCLVVGVSLISWYYAHAFFLLDRLMPLDFSTHEELLISKAELDTARLATDSTDILVIEAKFEAASYKRVEFEEIMGSMFELHRLALRVGLLLIIFVIPVFFLEIAWQKFVFNKALKPGVDKAGSV
ncbi:hypothetical protein [Thiopseudomonas acetoxidans]|uniref:Uncharacterized protein n=1 Tax=Thiopseudomonas acetoxidans TaxID=3041622 RepID=A0ABT7SRY2_9GAMM|nr:hypothetical protein [Thiopseudomonas sp. CY1220]MDM7858961.1 hypothetical protein [Thiopseudomonas sp. CY1220]